MSTISNVRWVGISQAGKLIVQLFSIILFARFLGPADFGLYALAMIFVNFANILRDMGTSAALIQRHALTGTFTDTVFWSNALFGIILGLIMVTIAPIAAVGFQDSRLTGLLMTIAIIFPISSSGSPHMALLERESRFRTLAALELFSSFFGLAVGVISILNKMGVYSLVFQTIATTCCSALLLWAVSSYRPRFYWNKDEFISLWRFSSHLVGFNIINYFSRNADSMLIGRLIGTVDLGIYNLAYRIMVFPIQSLTFVLNRALLPAFSRQQTDYALLGKNYLKALSFIALVTAPMMAGLWALREPLITTFLGSDWIRVAGILAWFAPIGFLQSLLSTTGGVFTAIGRTDLLRKIGFVCALVTVGMFVVSASFGIIWISISFLFSTLFSFAFAFKILLNELDVKILFLLQTVWCQAFSAITMAFALSVLMHYIGPFINEKLILATAIPAGACIYFSLIHAFSRRLSSEILDLGRKVKNEVFG